MAFSLAWAREHLTQYSIRKPSLEEEINLSGSSVLRQMFNIFCNCRLSKPVSSLPLVSEVFPTLRTVLEALNVHFTETDCKDFKSV